MSKTRAFYLLFPCLLVGILVLCLAAVEIGAAAPEATCTVPGSHATIQAAVDDLTCDLIDVAAGTFTENVTINHLVTVQGQGPAVTIVDGNASGSVFTIQAGAVVTLSGLTVQNGGATLVGGGILNGGMLTLNNSTLSGNSADHGGAIYNNGTLTVDNSTLSGNSTVYGGGGINNSYGTVALLNSTVSDNSAAYGGGILNSATLQVSHSTLSGNSADPGWGGGIYVDLTAGANGQLLNSIIANSPSGGDCRVGGPLVSLGYNIASDSTCNLTQPTDQPNTDPQLGPIQDNGGPTFTQALLPGSPALDAGSCPGATVDQRGFPRPVDQPGIPNTADGCDIGAFEAQVGTCDVPGTYGTIQGAANDPWCQVIDVAAGTFTESVTINRTVTIQGQAVGSTILDGQGSHRLFHIQSGGVVTLTGLTITNGYDSWAGGGIFNEGTLTVTDITLSGSWAQFGGGILNWGVLMASNCTLSGNSAEAGGAICHDGTRATVDHCSLVDNSATGEGGGIYTEYGTVVVDNSTLSGNVSANQGGGIFAGETVTITNSTLSGNTAVSEGGGIYTYSGASVVVDSSTLSGNSASSGGGILNRGTLLVTHSTLSANSVPNYGGGVYNTGKLTLSDSTFIDNVASGTGDSSGGAINTGSTGHTQISGTTFTNNHSIYGGALGSLGTVDVANSTFVGNNGIFGGAIESGGAITITSNTFSYNDAMVGGGIRNLPSAPGVMLVTNSIIAHNTTGNDCDGNVTSLGYNIASDGSCSLTGPGDQPNTDPRLGPLQDNGGPTFTQALMFASPALDAGFCPDATADQRGFPRPVDVPSIPDVADGCDIGALEFQNEWLVHLPFVLLTP